MSEQSNIEISDVARGGPVLHPGAFVAICRPQQWTKNLIVFAPILFAGKINELPLLANVVACLGCMCLMSSSIYIINDVLDRDMDRRHPDKKDRPIAANSISQGAALSLSGVLVVASLAAGFFIRPSLILVIGAYLVVMIAYSVKLKHYPLIDVFCIATGFVLRAVGGAAAAHVPVSPWFLLCTSLGALYLALEKRRQEMLMMVDDAELHRPSLTGYSPDMINRMEALVLPSLLTCYVFYSFQSWHGVAMLLTVPFVVYGLMRYQLLSHNSTAAASPDKLLLKDRPLQITIVLWILTSAAVVYNLIQPLSRAIIDQLDAFSLR